MTHNDIYIKFLIEYDKANVTSSYPALTEYEIATLLDRAYLLLIARKLTGNNTRRAPFEYDTKAIEDLRPLVKTDIFKYVSTGDTATNELKYKLPENMLYYLLGVVKYSNNMYDRELLTTIDHRSADNFKATNSNMPWIKKPVAYLEEDNLHVLLDPYKYFSSSKLKVTARPLMTGTYIITPAKFAIGVPPEEENNENDSNNGGNNNNGNNGNNDGGNGENEVYYWEIHDEFIPSTINNSDNKASFQLYAQKNLEKSECFVLIISGSNCISIQPKGNYTFDISVISTGNVLIKITCSKDNSINSTKQVYVVYNAPQNPDEGDNGGGNNNGGNSGGNENPTGINYIDLGLPSGTKWADRNLGAGSVTDRGKFYGWGEPTGNIISQTGQYGDYTLNLRGVAFPTDISKSNKDLDAAYVTLGGNWHTPTTELMLELLNNCTFTLQLNYNGISGLYGYEVRGKGEYSQNSIFIPCNGCRSGIDSSGNPVYSTNTNEAYYWSSEISDQPYGFGMFVKLLKGNLAVNKAETFYGMYIRPVYDGPYQGNEDTPTTVVTDEGQNVRMVDLGLSVLWADRNIGASKESDKGDYIAWGEIQPKEHYTLDNYQFKDNRDSIVSGFYLKPEHDAATQRWGSNYRMPTEDDIVNLLENCNCRKETRTDSNGNSVIGMIYESKLNGNSIFLPTSGRPVYNDIYHYTYYADQEVGYYWTNTKLTTSNTGQSAMCLMFSGDPNDTDSVPYRNDDSYLARITGILVRPVSPK